MSLFVKPSLVRNIKNLSKTIYRNNLFRQIFNRVHDLRIDNHVLTYCMGMKLEEVRSLCITKKYATTSEMKQAMIVYWTISRLFGNEIILVLSLIENVIKPRISSGH